MNYQLNNLYSKILSNDNYNYILSEDEELNLNSDYLIIDNSIISLTYLFINHHPQKKCTQIGIDVAAIFRF